MNEGLYKDIPAFYPLCLHADCPKANTCLRQLTFNRHNEQVLYLRLLNPARCTKQDNCPYYADCKPVIFAKGFTNFQKRMYPGQYAKFMDMLIAHFGRNPYFMRRRGETLLPPKEQEIVRRALKKSGVTETMEFDQYVEGINWEP